MTNVTLNKYLLVGTWDVIIYKTIKSAITLLLIRNRVLTKKITKLQSCTQNGRDVWKFLGFINLSKLI